MSGNDLSYRGVRSRRAAEVTALEAPQFGFLNRPIRCSSSQFFAKIFVEPQVMRFCDATPGESPVQHSPMSNTWAPTPCDASLRKNGGLLMTLSACR